MAAGFKDGYYAEWWFGSFGPQFLTTQQLDAVHAEAEVEQPAIAKSLQYLLDFKERGCMTPNAEGRPLFSDTIDEFSTDKAAMLISVDTADDIGWGAFDKTLGKDLGVMRFPNLPGSLHKSLRISFGPLRAIVDHEVDRASRRGLRVPASSAPARRSRSATGRRRAGSRTTSTRQPTKPAIEAGRQLLAWTRDPKVEKFIGFDTTIRPSVETTMVKLIPAVIIGQMSINDALDQVQAGTGQTPSVADEVGSDMAPGEIGPRE